MCIRDSPHAEQWRPALATALIVALLIYSALARQRITRLAMVWGVILPSGLLLMAGGAFGLTAVETSLWGGLPLTLLLSLGAFAGALPCGVLLALGRRSTLPAMRALCRVGLLYTSRCV